MSGAAAAAAMRPVAGGTRHTRGGPIGRSHIRVGAMGAPLAGAPPRRSRRVVTSAQRGDEGAGRGAQVAGLGSYGVKAGWATTTAYRDHTQCSAGRRRRRLAATNKPQVNSTLVEDQSERELKAATDALDLGRLPFAEPVGQGAHPALSPSLYPLSLRVAGLRACQADTRFFRRLPPSGFRREGRMR